jgi:hypothetical protein
MDTNADSLLGNGSYTVKVARGKVSFDSQKDQYASQLSYEYDASSEAYL